MKSVKSATASVSRPHPRPVSFMSVWPCALPVLIGSVGTGTLEFEALTSVHGSHKTMLAQARSLPVRVAGSALCWVLGHPRKNL